jgi:hypothetical protein
MNDERKGRYKGKWKEGMKPELKHDCMTDVILRERKKREIQQQPEIDDMKKYVRDEAERFMLRCPGIIGRNYESMIGFVRKFITQIVSDVSGGRIEVDMNFLIKWQKKISKGSGGGHISLISIKKMLEAIGAKFK